MLYREADVADMSNIFKLVKQFATSFVPDEQSFISSYEKLINQKTAKIIITEDKNCIIGYLLGFYHLTFYANGIVGWIEEIMVNENYRRQGIGNEMMKIFETWIRSNNGKLIGLATRRASTFYKAIGYEESAIFFRKILI
jgi:N-acetylglutamate synthase-like GNAT family acetyltransferase